MKNKVNLKKNKGFTPLENFTEQSSRKKQRNQKFLTGFTLIEVLVVILIIGIVATISWASIQKIQPSLRLSSSIKDLSVDIRYAQQLAVTEQVNYGIYFSSSTDSYHLLRYGVETADEVFEKFLSQGVSFQQISGFENGEAIFNPYGAVQEAGEIFLINEEGKVRNIQVKPSGFVKITE